MLAEIAIEWTVDRQAYIVPSSIVFAGEFVEVLTGVNHLQWRSFCLLNDRDITLTLSGSDISIYLKVLICRQVTGAG